METVNRLYLLKTLAHPDYDEARAFVVSAPCSLHARAFAADNCGDEGPTVWTDSTRSTCDRIDDDVPAAGVVIRDFHAG